MEPVAGRKKEYIPYDVVRNNSLKLAHRIHASGFIPDIIYVSLRGGAYIGNIMSEYFKLVRREPVPLLYAAVVARTFRDTSGKFHVAVDGWTYHPDNLRYGDRVLLVDDIFDSGNTINHLVRIILDRGIVRKDIKVAVHDYKLRHYEKSDLPIHPDFYCRFHELRNPEDDIWIHYLSHELEGLTAAELRSSFESDDPEISTVLRYLGEMSDPV